MSSGKNPFAIKKAIMIANLTIKKTKIAIDGLKNYGFLTISHKAAIKVVDYEIERIIQTEQFYDASAKKVKINIKSN